MSRAERVSLRLISYNIQAGSTTSQYSDYVTKSWRQVLPSSGRIANLEAIAGVLSGHDIAGLQETDDGSLRTGFVNLTEFLAERAGYRYWSHQSNRRISRLARTCNALLSRRRPHAVDDHKLPGRVAGRGALAAYYNIDGKPLLVVISHLSLGRPSRRTQLAALREIVAEGENVVVMGDLNVHAESTELKTFLDATGLRTGSANRPTFPSWRPQRALDHVLVSPGIEITNSEVLEATYSDHRPLSVTISF